MNYPEKIAGAYLRLNGFFLLPHFTVFDQRQHTHVDFLALRPANSQESVNKDNLLILPVDDEFMNLLGELIDYPKSNFIGLVVEVKSGEEKEVPSQEHREYVDRFFGKNVKIFNLSFCGNVKKPTISNGSITIGVEYAFEWIISRILWMNANMERLIKTRSWNMSEEFLSEILYLIEHKLIK